MNNIENLKRMLLETRDLRSTPITELTLERHYIHFQHCLNQLDGGARMFSKNNEETRDFVSADLINLITRPYNAQTRTTYLESVQQSHETLPLIHDYKGALLGLGNPTQTLCHLGDYYRNNTPVVNNMFGESRMQFTIDLPQMVEFKQAVELLASRLKYSTDAQVEVMGHFSEHYEKFALVTMEPYMYVIFGNHIFFSIFVQMHRTGVFHMYMDKVSERRDQLLNTWFRKLMKTLKYINDLGDALMPLMDKMVKILVPSSTIAGISFGLLTQNRNISPETITTLTQRATTAQDFVNNNLRGEGFQNFYLDSFRDQVGKIGFEIGRFSAIIGLSVMQGALERNVDEIEEAATDFDIRRDEASRRGER